MNRRLLNRAIRNNPELFDLSKFNLDGITINDCLILYEGKHIIVKPKKNLRMKKYLYQCQMCNRFFLGGRDATEEYVGNCFGKKTGFKSCRDYFYKSELNIATVYKEGVKKYRVTELLDILYKENKKAPGVWALWEDFGKETEKCIQVAKNQDIYQEIYDDFEKGHGSIDYSKYRENGTIVIVSDRCNCIRMETQYAHDYYAEYWNPGVSESKQIGIAKGLRK